MLSFSVDLRPTAFFVVKLCVFFSRKSSKTLGAQFGRVTLYRVKYPNFVNTHLALLLKFCPKTHLFNFDWEFRSFFKFLF